MRALPLSLAAIAVSAFACSERGGERGGGSPEPPAHEWEVIDRMSGDPPGPVSPEAAARHEIAVQFLAELKAACDQGTAPPALPLAPSQLGAVVANYALGEALLHVGCVRRKLRLPEHEPAGLDEAILMAMTPYPANWVERLERMCADPGFQYDHLSALEFPENRHFLVETPREDALRAFAAARCVARRIARDRPPAELNLRERTLLFRLNNLFQGIVARYDP